MPLRGEASKPTYRIDDRLSGGPAADDVFLAWHNIFRGPCVQKRVQMHGFEDALAASEPEFLNKLKHPHIVEVREAQWDPQQDRAIIFVMRLYEGGSIEKALAADYRFSLHQAIDLSVQVLDALAYVNREFGAVHRDIKPGNVLMDDARSNAFLSDFGSAAKLDASGEAAAVLGTDHYRPPEAKKTGRVGRAADLYGVGMALFEMLNGRLPWEQHDFAKIEERLREGRRALSDAVLAEHAPHLPPRLQRVVNKAIARDPDRRFRSPEEFIRALNAGKMRSIDWRHESGSGLVGEWVGTWPPTRPLGKRTTYRVKSRSLEAGPEKGKLRLEAQYRRPGGTGWRQAVKSDTLDPADRAGVAAFIDKVEAKAAQREPAR
jgi:eukaryotic-like serine/threonine-protein kinase